MKTTYGLLTATFATGIIGFSSGETPAALATQVVSAALLVFTLLSALPASAPAERDAWQG